MSRKQVTIFRCGLAHAPYEALVGEEIAAINCVVKMLPGDITLAFEVLSSMDATLCAHRMRALDRNDREKFHGDAALGNANRRHQPSQAAANDNDFGLFPWM
jgi:hypothetical protein